YAHFGSFYTTDGGRTYASNYWHVPNPDLQPQHKETVEVNVLQTLAADFQVSASGFYSRFSNLIQSADADRASAGFYHGWPVDYLDFAVNEGRAVSYGGTLAADYVVQLAPARRVEAHAALTIVGGREWSQAETTDSLPSGAMTPVQLRVGADLDWDRWRVAPRVSVAGRQRVLATVEDGDRTARRTVPGFYTLDVNLRRRLSAKLDAFLTVENALDRRYRTANQFAYINPQEMIGVPQNPRRVTIGVTVSVR
ncbi:MAG: TonB-dependent receptor, partial [Vicinamibacterales bacterium]